MSIFFIIKTDHSFSTYLSIYLEQSQDDNIKMLVLKWTKVFDGVQVICNRLQQDVQLHSEFKG